MADTKISGLPAASAATGTNELPINEGGVSKKLTVTQIATFVGAGALAPASVAATGTVSCAALVMMGEINPGSLGGTTDNWNVGSLANVGTINITASVSVNIDGILATGVTEGQRILLRNLSAYAIGLVHESGGSTAANRFWVHGGGSYVIEATLGIIECIYRGARFCIL